MWRLRVVHSTGYAYKSPVTASFNEARLTPRSDSRQNVILNRVETEPAQPPENEVDWADLRSEPVIDRFDEVLTPTRYTPDSRHIRRVGQRIAKDHKPHEAVIAAAHWVRGELAYVPGTTGVHSSGLDALREGKGVCQDFAHLTLILLRSMGIPARYVSGYLHSKRDAVIGDTIDGQSHAWIQAWTGGWWHYDPTNDSEITEQYVSVGVGRDYADVAPLKGIYRGEGSTDLDVVVEITRLA